MKEIKSIVQNTLSNTYLSDLPRCTSYPSRISELSLGDAMICNSDNCMIWYIYLYIYNCKQLDSQTILYSQQGNKQSFYIHVTINLIDYNYNYKLITSN